MSEARFTGFPPAARTRSPEPLAPTPSKPSPSRDTAPDTADPSRRRSSLSTLATLDRGGRRTVAGKLIRIAENMGMPKQDTFDISAFRRGEADNFPETPGEAFKNRTLPEIRRTYNVVREEEDNRSMRSVRSAGGRERSRSRGASVFDGVEGEGLTRSRTTSPVRAGGRPGASPTGGNGTASEPTYTPRIRSNTLEVPSAARMRPRQSTHPTTAGERIVAAEPGSPVIVVSDEDATPSISFGVVATPRRSTEGDAGGEIR
jgi:hypothetical protein